MKKNSLLKSIKSPADIRKIPVNQLKKLSNEVSDMIKETVEENGGHYSSPLGVVDLTIALHYVYNSPIDKMVWDVGHQAYSHKILTGRQSVFHTMRQKNGISGFLKRSESEHDVYGAGHSSTSISAALGFAHSRDIKKKDSKVVAIIGDGAMTNGLAYEAINNLGFHKTQLTIILNDNTKSISNSVGALSRYLTKIITNPTYNRFRGFVWNIFSRAPFFKSKAKRLLKRTEGSLKHFLTPGGLFEELGLRYVGPIDGHNIKDMISLFNNIKNINTPVLVHVVTKKGKNSNQAEEDAVKYYSLSGSKKKNPKTVSYSNVFGDIVTNSANKNSNFLCITAAMEIGTGLSDFKSKHPGRFIDVGIAEGHAATYASGIAASGIIPVIVLYSTFSQRAYDNFVHDFLLQDLPFILCLDRSGLVGEDGPTHHGVLDICMFISMPKIIIAAPKNGDEFKDLFHTALKEKKAFVIRYPKGDAISYSPSKNEKVLDIGKWEVLKSGEKSSILAVGSMVDVMMRGYSKICSDLGYSPNLINARFIKPIDKNLLDDIMSKSDTIVTLEEASKIGGFGSFVLNYANSVGYRGKIHILGIGDDFVDQGPRDYLLKKCGLTVDSVIESILDG